MMPAVLIRSSARQRYVRAGEVSSDAVLAVLMLSACISESYDCSHEDRRGVSDARWEREVLEPALKKAPERATPFTTISGRPIDRLYTPDSLAGFDTPRDLSQPGEFPYTRGIHPTGYRGRLWTMRQFAGYGTPEETNERYKTLLAGGRHRPERRLRSADADGTRPRSRAVARRSREVRRQHRVAGRHGTAVRRHRARGHHDLDDDQLAGADDLRDVPRRRRAAGRRLATLSGTIQNDILKEFIAQKEYIYPAARIDAADHRRLRVLRRAKSASGTRSRSAAITSVKRDRQRCRSWRSRCATASSTSSTASTPGSTSTTSRRASRSSSTRTATSSRRSPSSARRAGCGPR